ncbi:TPA_asm: hypothetical protein [Porphyromonas phage phage029a_Kyudai3]|uniref:Uncharacterized protein n=1 Tax=Porphyromonas phage phage029a_Kyudai3 TaxID=3154119 RepID=A0AAT9J9B6_9CAUD
MAAGHFFSLAGSEGGHFSQVLVGQLIPLPLSLKYAPPDPLSQEKRKTLNNLEHGRKQQKSVQRSNKGKKCGVCSIEWV